MFNTKSSENRLVLFTILIIVSIAISAKLIYSEINESKKLSTQSKLVARSLDHLDKLNSSFTYIERNERPFLIVQKRNSVEEIGEGYKMAFAALDSLSKKEFESEISLIELDNLKGIVKEKKQLSDQVIRFSLLNQPEIAINALANSNDSLLIRKFYFNYNNLQNRLVAKIGQLQEMQIKESQRIFVNLLVTVCIVVVFIVFFVFKLFKQINLKNDLLSQNKTFSDIIHFSSDSIIVHDQDFKITYSNKATENLFGYNSQDIIGKDPDDQFQTLAAPEFIMERRNTIQKYGFWMGELKRKDALGNILDLHITLNSFRNHKGNIKGFFSIASDITKLVKAQNEVKTLADSLTDLNKNLKQQVASQTTLIKDVFERVQEVFIGTDSTFKINYASKHIEPIFGISLERVYGMDMKAFLFEISGPQYIDAPQVAFDTHQNKRFQFEHMETGHWFEANIFPSKNGVSIHFKDISEKLKTDEEVLKSKKMYEFISKANELILIAKNEDELLQSMCDLAISFNDIIFSWFGALDKESNKIKTVKWAGKEDGYFSAIKSISIEDMPEGNGPTGIAYRSGKYFYVNDIATNPVMNLWRDEALKRGYRSDIAIPIKVDNVVVYTFTLYTSKPYFFTEEYIDLLINISENISFALKAFYVAELRKASDQQLHKVLKAIEQSSASVVISDVNGTIEYVNPAFTNLTGYTFEEAIGQNPRILKTGYTSDAEYVNLWDNLTHSKEWAGEFCNKKKNGELYWEFAVISPVLNDQGVITNYVAVKENITTQKNLQEEQRRLTADIIKRNHDLEKFSYVLSHNIRGPLSNILGLKDAILRKSIDSEYKGLMQAISTSAESMDQVIKDVTQVINKTKLSLDEKKEILFEHLLQSVKEDIGSFLQDKKAVIETDFSKASSCYSLESYLNSIFYHLTVNALKFSKPSLPAKIQIWTEVLNNKTVIHFKDYGIGIDLKRYGKIIFGLYKRFQMNIEGKGIGLYLVKSQVDFLGGDIEIKSELSQWTEFIISLPNDISNATI